MTPEDVVRANYAAYRAQDRPACEALLAEDVVFTSPQDDHIDREAFLDAASRPRALLAAAAAARRRRR